MEVVVDDDVVAASAVATLFGSTLHHHHSRFRALCGQAWRDHASRSIVQVAVQCHPHYSHQHDGGA